MRVCSANPCQDVYKRQESTPAKHVFVLPNNKNIIMAAEQTVNLADRGVSVVAPKTVPQGITAMLNFDESLSSEENLSLIHIFYRPQRRIYP